MAAPKPQERVLDLGCGRGEVVHEAAKLRCKAVGVDYSPDAMEIARRGAFGTPWDERCKFILARTEEDVLPSPQKIAPSPQEVFRKPKPRRPFPYPPA